MKNLKVIIALLAIVFASSSFKPVEELKWLGFNEGYALAKKKNKIMLVDVYTDWCGWCKRMDRDTYAKGEIIEMVNKDFVAIKFNPELDATYEFEGKKYNGQQLAGVISNNQISGYPTTIFMYPAEKKTKVVGGYLDQPRMSSTLGTVKSELQPDKKAKK